MPEQGDAFAFGGFPDVRDDKIIRWFSRHNRILDGGVRIAIAFLEPAGDLNRPKTIAD